MTSRKYWDELKRDMKPIYTAVNAEAARAAFAEGGLEGARVDDIARRAGINKQLVYHYFGSKDGLFF